MIQTLSLHQCTEQEARDTIAAYERAGAVVYSIARSSGGKRSDWLVTLETEPAIPRKVDPESTAVPVPLAADIEGVDGLPMGHADPDYCTNCLAHSVFDTAGRTWYPPKGHTVRADRSIECPDERIITIGLAGLADEVAGIMRTGRVDQYDAQTFTAVLAAITGWSG